ncbi:hypothetical protein [Thalassococcus lentus]|uniref:Uncharacterized protein n=1 Tax=Thalassococcus lentus TaxID=1210524 RepID=A0ABT4XWC4_9RHOB|nr:hypothetical protein [Thalassococcus lentus]MDA7426270.1 hypothetical protein [Thalassococcus lentus]
MDRALRDFDKRQKAIRRKHTRMAKGYRNKMNANGVIMQKPDSKIGGYLSRILFLAVLAFMAFKVLLLTGIGEELYMERVSVLQLGNTYERAGAWLMQIDPVTAWLSQQAAAFLL